jgi:hypothetical protein
MQRRRTVLLHDVHELMRQQTIARLIRGVSPCAEHDVVAHGEGEGAHGPRRLCGRPLGVEAHSTEIVSEAGLEVRAHVG